MQPEAYLEMADAEDVHWWFRGRRQILASVIGAMKLAPGARILELGCGTGGNIAMLSRFGAVTAVEMDDTARDIALRKTGGIAEIRAGALPDRALLGDELFDLICLFDVLEHVDDDAATLVLIARHLAPGGRAVVTVPAFQKLWGPHDVALHHKRRYGKTQLRDKLLASGFVIEKLSYMNTALFPAAVAARMLDHWRGAKEAGFTQTPARPVNEAFAWLFGAERHLLRRFDLPVGLSLLAVVGKK